jgi:hypothetical protein
LASHAGLGAGGGPAGLAGWGGSADQLRLAVATGDRHRFTGPRSGLAGPGGRRAIQRRPTQPGLDHQHRQPPHPTAAGRGGLAAPQPSRPSQQLRARHAGQPAVVRERADHGTAGCSSAGAGWTPGASAPPSAWSRSPASPPDGAGAWPSWSLTEHPPPARWAAPTSAGSNPRPTSEQPGRSNRWATLDLSTSRPLPTPTRSCARQPAQRRLTAQRVRPPRPPAQPSTPPPRRPAHAPAT